MILKKYNNYYNFIISFFKDFNQKIVKLFNYDDIINLFLKKVIFGFVHFLKIKIFHYITINITYLLKMFLIKF